MQDFDNMTGVIHLMAGIVCVVSLLIAGALMVVSHYLYARSHTKILNDPQHDAQHENQEKHDDTLNCVGKHTIESASIRHVAQQGVQNRHINSYKKDSSMIDIGLIAIIICSIVLTIGAIWNLNSYFHMI